jgi:hypothetical protein
MSAPINGEAYVGKPDVEITDIFDVLLVVAECRYAALEELEDLVGVVVGEASLGPLDVLVPDRERVVHLHVGDALFKRADGRTGVYQRAHRHVPGGGATHWRSSSRRRVSSAE